jgi:hypothetical protein
MLKRVSLSLSISTIVFAAAVSSGAAQTVTECTGNLAPGNYDALDVPAGATCTINNGTVNVITGGVTVGARATFFVPGPPSSSLVITSGSLDSHDANVIEVTANIHGHMAVVGTTGAVIITDSFIGGTVAVTHSNDVSNVVSRNTVGGTMYFQSNQCSNEANCNTVAANSVQSLICTDNTPAPSDLAGGPNTAVIGKAEQCSGL